MVILGIVLAGITIGIIACSYIDLKRDFNRRQAEADKQINWYY